MTNEPTEKREGWEEEFWEYWYESFDHEGGMNLKEYNELLAFIRSIRTQAFNEGIDAAVGCVEGAKVGQPDREAEEFYYEVKKTILKEVKQVLTEALRSLKKV